MIYEDIISEVAKNRESIHEGHSSSRPLSKDYETVGLAGEFAFGEIVGFMPDVSGRPKGDGGVDFVLPLLFTVDVKTARKPYHLIHESGKPFCDIYILAEFSDESHRATVVGWCFDKELAAAPTKDFGYGVINHYIPRENLRPVRELAERVFRPRTMR